LNPRLAALVEDLYADGVAHDAMQPDRLLKRRNLEPATANLLSFLVRIAGARRVVEIGTANGYSTIWLADAVGDTGGHVASIDTASNEAARGNLARADAVLPGLAQRVELRQEDGGGYLTRLADRSIDVLLLDAERVEYPKWWPHPIRVLRPGGVVAIDNVLSHADEVAPFLTLLAGEPTLVGATVAVGKGLHLAWRRPSVKCDDDLGGLSQHLNGRSGW
jgi:predicted O-methyltransferase YrrM